VAQWCTDGSIPSWGKPKVLECCCSQFSSLTFSFQRDSVKFYLRKSGGLFTVRLRRLVIMAHKRRKYPPQKKKKTIGVNLYQSYFNHEKYNSTACSSIKFKFETQFK